MMHLHGPLKSQMLQAFHKVKGISVNAPSSSKDPERLRVKKRATPEEKATFYKETQQIRRDRRRLTLNDVNVGVPSRPVLLATLGRPLSHARTVVQNSVSPTSVHQACTAR